MAPSCAHCLKEDAKLRCSKCKAVFYCEKNSAPLQKPFIAVEHAIERAIEVECLKKSHVDPPSNVHCFICLEGGDGLLSQGCGCRGTSGFVHPECLASMASSTAGDSVEAYKRFRVCHTCGRKFSGILSVVMARTCWRSYRLSDNEGSRRDAARRVAVAIQCRSPDLAALEYLYAEELTGLSDNHPRRIMNLVHRANTLSYSEGRVHEALDLLQRAYPEAKLRCDEADIAHVVDMTASVLLKAGRAEEAVPIAAEAVQRAGRISEERLHLAKETYAMALASSGRLEEARAIWEPEVGYLERVYGATHVRTNLVKRAMAYFFPSA